MCSRIIMDFTVVNIYRSSYLKMEHEIAALEMVILLILLGVIILWDNIPLVKCVPSSVIAVCLGMIVSSSWSETSDAPFVFAPELFLYLLLPVILLHSSFKFDMNSLRKTWLSSLMFAWVGTLLCIVLIAWGIIVWSSFYDLHISFVDSLLIASILAPTDTVATLTLSKELDDPFIADVLENEAVLNDAIAVVMVRLFATMSENHQRLNKWVPMRAVGISILFMCLSAGIGILSAKLIRYSQIESAPLHFIIALIVYAGCEYLGISGIVGLFSYGSLVNPPQPVKTSIENVSVIVEAYVYLTIGLALHSYDTTMIGMSFLILLTCITSRVLIVFSLGGCLRCCGRTQWTVPSLLFFSMCGIRGAISFAMCMGLRSEWSNFIQSTAFVVIIFTIVSMGTLQKCMQQILLTPYKQTMPM